MRKLKNTVQTMRFFPKKYVVERLPFDKWSEMLDSFVCTPSVFVPNRQRKVIDFHFTHDHNNDFTVWRKKKLEAFLQRSSSIMFEQYVGGRKEIK